MGTGKLNAGSNPVMDWHPIQGGMEILLVTSCYRNQDKLWPDGPLGSYAYIVRVFIKGLAPGRYCTGCEDNFVRLV